METLFPDGASIQGLYSNTRSIETGVNLPNPPDDVAQILLRVQDLNLGVAATAEAIRFNDTPSVLIAGTYNERARAGEYPDPIIFIEQGEAVAVIAQFGDFPVEREVVDRVVNSEHLF